MAAKGPQQGIGGAGNKTAQSWVMKLREEGKTEPEIRQTLKEYSYKAGRISQLIKATRPAEGQAGAVTARRGERAFRRPSAASGFQDRPASEGETEDEAGGVLLPSGF